MTRRIPHPVYVQVEVVAVRDSAVEEREPRVRRAWPRRDDVDVDALARRADGRVASVSVGVVVRPWRFSVAAGIKPASRRRERAGVAERHVVR